MFVSVVTVLMPMLASACGSAPSYSDGYPIAPTPRMNDCPGMRRGTEWTVPIIPGFVIVAVVPAKSSGDIFCARTLPITSSYAAQKPAKSRASAPLMLGTSSVRVPSGRSTSTARPRLTCGWCTSVGAPSCSA